MTAEAFDAMSLPEAVRAHALALVPKYRASHPDRLGHITEVGLQLAIQEAWKLAADDELAAARLADPTLAARVAAARAARKAERG